jgi:hypothetical protein
VSARACPFVVLEVDIVTRSHATTLDAKVPPSRPYSTMITGRCTAKSSPVQSLSPNSLQVASGPPAGPAIRRSNALSIGARTRYPKCPVIDCQKSGRLCYNPKSPPSVQCSNNRVFPQSGLSTITPQTGLIINATSQTFVHSLDLFLA